MESTPTNKTMKGLLAFVGWTVTSFICHQSAKLFIKGSRSDGVVTNGVVLAALVTMTQAAVCLLATNMQIGEQVWVFRMKVLTHLLATMATNYSMTLIDASSTFAIKLFEPVTSALVQYMLLKKNLNPAIFVSLPAIIGGAIMFCGSSVNSSALSLGGLMALCSNVLLGFRNVAIKMESGDGSKPMIQLRPTRTLAGISLVISLILTSAFFITNIYKLTDTVLVQTATLMVTSLFHVVYSYISTNVVLQYLTVLSHSVANIMKRVLVVFMLFFVGKREATAVNFMGLGLCTVGLMAYSLSLHAAKSPGILMEIGSSSRMRIVMTSLLLFVMGGCGLLYTSSVDRYSLGANRNQFLVRGREFFKYQNNDAETNDFLNRRLITTPTETNVLSPKLTTTFDVIDEAQRVHMNLFKDMFAGFKYAMLFDLAVFENKGDPFISAAEAYLIRRLGLKLLYYCSYCRDKRIHHARNISQNYSPKELVILLQGGGNIVGYPKNDYVRASVLKHFPGFKKVLFPQSVYITKSKRHLTYCQKIYTRDENFTMILRDRQSLQLAQQYFSGKGQLILAPDMAFQVGHVDRYMSPAFDVLWIKRGDWESPNYEMPSFPEGTTVHEADWWDWQTPEGVNSMETAFLMANNGLVFLQRGRVVVTDRLHGHILSVLLDIPHVIIDNSYKKISAYHYTWTAGLENTVVADNATHAVDLALYLLDKYKDTLPKIVPFMDVKESVK